jgi:ascorbate-specific PTS system EIIC-type component UlaA
MYLLLFVFSSELEGYIEPTIFINTLLLSYIGLIALALVSRPVDNITKSNSFSLGAPRPNPRPTPL